MRPDWDTYFLDMARLASTRATCPRASVGCVLVVDGQVVATGYNGSAPGMPHCHDEGCIIIEGHCARTIHAEVNAIGQAARLGVSVKHGTAYVTHTPCANCLKVLASAGIERVVALKRYGLDDLAETVSGLEIEYV